MSKKTFGYKCVTLSRGMLRRFEQELSYICDAYNYSFRAADVKARVKRIDGGYRGSIQEYRDIVLRYWSRYGLKPKKDWYDLYCAGRNAYDPRFIPDPIWFHDIVPYFNNLRMNLAYVDKGIYNRLLFDVKKPETVVKCSAGYYYNGDGEEPITREEAENLCLREEHLILKPSLGSKGAGILFYDSGKDDTNISSLFDAMGKNFVVQKLVSQHPDLARLNPDSLNTIRLLSFRFKGEVHVLSAQLRIGGSGSRVDNVSAGGSACAVYPDGRLHEKSVTRKSTWTDETANGIKLSTIRIPNYSAVVETVKRLHCELPYYNIIGWDFAVDQDGEPVFIEFNTKPGQNQIGGREPTFGDLTDEVLDEVFIKKTMKK